MLKSLSKLGDSFVRALPWIFLLVGGALLSLGAFGSFPWTALNEVLKQGGGAILAGGVFAALLKSFQYMGIFKESLADVVRSERSEVKRALAEALRQERSIIEDSLASVVWSQRYLENRLDQAEMWKLLTSLIYRRRFPEIEAALHDTIITQYLPTKLDYYIDRFDADIVVDWANPERTRIRTTETLLRVVIPADPKKAVEFDFAVRPEGDGVVELCEVSVDQEDRSKNYDPVPGGGKIWRLKLEGRDRYVVWRRLVYTFSLDADPLHCQIAKSFVTHSSVQVRCNPDDLMVTFATLGTLMEFDDVRTPQVRNSRPADIHMRSDKLIFPFQGHALVFHRKSPVAGARH